MYYVNSLHQLLKHMLNLLRDHIHAVSHFDPFSTIRKCKTLKVTLSLVIFYQFINKQKSVVIRCQQILLIHNHLIYFNRCIVTSLLITIAQMYPYDFIFVFRSLRSEITTNIKKTSSDVRGDILCLYRYIETNSKNKFK